VRSPAPTGRSLLRVIVLAIVLSSLMFGLQVLPAYAAAGDLDITFGTGGKVTTNPGAKGWGNQLAIQGDGKILLTGFSGRAPLQDFALLRYNVNGSLDTTFGPNHTGIVTYDNAGKKDEARAIAIQPDGKILIGGYSGADYALLRYNSDGTLDATFGTGGIVITDIFAQDSIRAILLQPDGKIVAAGFSGQYLAHDFSLARYNANGTLDATFGTGGTVRTDFGADEQSRGAVLQADGKFVVAGYSKSGTGGTAFYQFAVARYNSNGSLDTTFGPDGTGKVLTSLDPQASVIRAIVLQPDGNYIVCGYTGGGGGLPSRTAPSDPDIEVKQLGGDYTVARYLTNGTLDPSFGTTGTGYNTVDLGGNDHARGCALQTDGKIVLGGSTSDALDTNENFGIVRYNPDGTLDTTFGVGGIVRTDFRGKQDGARDVKIDSSGRIVAAGIAGAVAGGGFLMALARYLGS
jgi:uncharacterized delta-60 repeat protein